MKKIYSIISLCFMAAALLVSCNDDDNINTADVSVAFGEQTYSVKENKGLFTIPVVVNGEPNGPVYVDVEVSANSADCKEDVNYYVTSKHIVINPAKKQANIEIKSVDDRVINADRQFTLTITKAEGAQISKTLASADIILRDNDDIPYERMAGTWTIMATNVFSESGHDPISWDMQLITVDEEDDAYGSAITSTPWALFDGSLPVLNEDGDMLSHPMTFHHNAGTGVTTVDMRIGSIMSPEIDLGIIEADNGSGGKISVDCTKATFRSATEGFGGSLSYSGTITGIVNSDFTEVRFSQPLYIILFSTNGQPFQYQACFTNIILKLKK